MTDTKTDIKFNLLKNEDGANLTVYDRERGTLQATEDHPHWDEILQGVLSGDLNALDLFDLALTAGKKFQRVSERVTHAYGKLYFDGNEINSTLGDHIVAMLAAGEEFGPTVKFLEKLETNPNEHSREMLWDFLQANGINLNDEGDIVTYKGVLSDGNGGFKSSSSGSAIVNDEVFEGQIPNPIGAVVEMPRDQVMHDPNAHCHSGLHVGSHKYASGFAEVLLEVHVNPRDVVSVPRSGGDKMRVSRYKVVAVNKKKVVYSTPVVRTTSGSANATSSSSKVTVKTTTDNDVRVGDEFEDRDSRRKGRTLKVVKLIDKDHVEVESKNNLLPGSRKRTIRIDRLTGRKYNRTKRGRKV